MIKSTSHILWVHAFISHFCWFLFQTLLMPNDSYELVKLSGEHEEVDAEQAVVLWDDYQ